MVKIPVALIGGVKRLEQVNFVLSDSKIEYFGIVRGLMKDPQLIKKWKSQE
jgi:2,4-dienoyl-CoA reductase-like NADH-dependent reductase (Old Yellow Enzyme family)